MNLCDQLVLFGQYGNESSGGSPLFWFCYFAFIAAAIIGMWLTFQKAGKPGWAAIIPIYNLVVLMQVAGRPVWWVILMFIPFVNFFIALIVSIDVAKHFGKGAGFGLGLAFLGFVFYPILGLGDSRYQSTPTA